MALLKTAVVLIFVCLIVASSVDAKRKKNKNKKNKNHHHHHHHHRQPNIIFILIDDLGYNDVGWHSDIKTPAIDSLAASGVILENNYVAPVCTPSRGSIMTGMYPWHVGMQHGVLGPASTDCAPKENPMLPEELQKLGYTTYMVGKWHLGYCNISCSPTHRGFDKFYGFYNGYVSHFTHSINGYYDWRDQDEPAWDNYGKYSVNLIKNRANQYIRQHSKSKTLKNTPLYMYLPFATVHSPAEAPYKYIEQYLDEPDYHRRMVKAMMTATDDAIASIVKTLKKTDMYDNTVIAFTSDNGGEAGYSSNFPLRGAKASSWEGGVRVPGFFSSPLMKSSKGVISKELFHESDWFPTLLSMAGGNPSDSLDGVDQTELLMNGGVSAREDIPIHIDQYDGPIFGRGTIRNGKWKLIKGFPGLWNGYDTVIEGQNALHLTHLSDSLMKRDAEELIEKRNAAEVSDELTKRGNYNFDFGAIARYTAKVDDSVLLFDLENDPSETTDVAAAHPEVVADLLARLDKYTATAGPVDLGAARPNPAADARLFGGIWSPGWCNY